MATATKPISTSSRLALLQAPALKKIPWLVHGFSTRPGGASVCYGGKSLNLGFTKDDSRDHVEQNRRKLLAAMGATSDRMTWPLTSLRQIHSDIIHLVESPAADPLIGDGLITNRPGIALAVMTADCLPVMLIDKKNRAVGVFHAGWRGTVQRITEKGLGAMRCHFGSMPSDIEAVIGPGIGGCCYEVGEELKSKFESQFAYASELFHQVFESDPIREKYPMLFMNARAPGHGDPCAKLHLDLAEANRRQVLAMGVPDDQITVLGQCTACNPTKFFSHRAEKGKTGRMMAVVGISPFSRTN
ncbi:MAG TPA: peptidoglycan editing factor PgeF [Candidatus Angelobacter sp.]|nr:peptidoglycan editing factor PgeF [Candidatus Angelobacter sp.]